ncbi:MFS transporter [Pseudomonas eucalypticola]|uniref:MFS transporter n=1 Tax=Pseudomonas eucalypticola TaxID=2599595 RepID=UPI001FD7F976|nr:MFS transporter [Pseudomonas eucalypticola]
MDLAKGLTQRQRTLIIFALSLGAFAIGVSEFSSMGLLLDISRSLAISTTQAGHLISLYALGVLIGAPVLAFTAARLKRKTLLVALALFYAGANLASALAPSYGSLLVARFCAGLPHGAYFGVAMLAAAAISPPAQRGAAVSKVLLGFSLAILVGSPVATGLGQHFTWRIAFVLVGSLALMTAALVGRTLPQDPAEEIIDPRREVKAFNTPQVWLALLIGAIGYAGMFCVYTYLAPVLVSITGVAESWMPWVSAAFGLGSVIGAVAGGWLVDRLGFKATGVILLWSCVILLVFPCAMHALWSLCSSVIGVGTLSALSVALQTRLIEVAGRAQTLAATSNHAAFNIANALGPWAGGMAITGGMG